MGRWTADRRRLKQALLGVIAALLLVLAVVFYGYRNTLKPAQTLTDVIKAGATLAMDKVEYTAVRDGRVQWRLSAADAALIEESQSLQLTAPDVVFFADDGREIHVTADQGRLNTQTNDMEASGHVILWDDGYRMRTEKLTYRHQANRIDTDHPVAIDGGWASLTADRMVIDLSTRQAIFTGTIRGMIRDGIS